MCWDARFVFLLLASTAITYISGLALESIGTRRLPEGRKNRFKKYVVAASAVSNLGILFFFKYFNYALYIFSKLNIHYQAPAYDIILPVGISFYTFQALGYTVDVYRGDIKAEKNFFRYALFVSFFPQLVAGPIERSKNLLRQLDAPAKFSFEDARDGFLLMLWGYFLKIVLADRIAVFVDTVYGNYETYNGYYLIVATALFAVQIYCDFAGYSTIAIGTAKILGIRLMENFDAPYLSLSVSDFWRKWHISLTSWFRDYLYIPLGGNRKGRIRKYINKMIVFLLSGLWHGAGTSYVIWGALNGLYQVAGEILQPVRNALLRIFRLHRESVCHKLLCALVTFILVDFSWIFFRASSAGTAVAIIQSMFTDHNPWILFDGSLYQCGLDDKNFRLMLYGIGILGFADFCKHRGVVIREVIARQDYWFRWIFIALAVTGILTFGIWGPNYNAANFIYFQF